MSKLNLTKEQIEKVSAASGIVFPILTTVVTEMPEGAFGSEASFKAAALELYPHLTSSQIEDAYTALVPIIQPPIM